LLRADAIAESKGDPNAVSPAGAEGLFQLMPDTARKLGLRPGDAFDPMKSAQAAAQLLSKLIKQYGNLPDALRAYNWGPGNIQKYGMALMPQETRDYVPRVMSNMPGGGIQQETNIYISGVSDPLAAGREVAGRQTGVNSRLAHDMGTTPR
jgi:beta-lactamase class A